MKIQDIAIILSIKPHNDNLYLIRVLTQNHGIYSSIVKIGKKNYSLFPSSIIDFTWQARVPEHIGSAKCELVKSFDFLLKPNYMVLLAVRSLLALIEGSFKERYNIPELFMMLKAYLEDLENLSFSVKAYIKSEMEILRLAGYKVDLSKCAVTNIGRNLAFVSPKSGMAVCFSSGESYKDRLLPLPQFLVKDNAPCLEEDIKNAFNLTGYFLKRYIFNNNYKNIPYERGLLTKCLLKEKEAV